MLLSPIPVRALLAGNTRDEGGVIVVTGRVGGQARRSESVEM